MTVSEVPGGQLDQGAARDTAAAAELDERQLPAGHDCVQARDANPEEFGGLLGSEESVAYQGFRLSSL